MCRSSGAIDCADFMSTIDYSRSNSNNNDQENILDDYVVISSSASTVIVQNDDDNSCEQDDNNSDYFAQFSCPDDSDNDSEYFYDDDNNDDLFINNHLNNKQLNLINKFEEKNYQRSKRSNKKLHAQCQIKTKHAKSIKIKSHNKQLYIHHRLAKQVQLDPPSRNYIPSPSSVPLYSSEALRPIVYEDRHLRPPIHSPKKIQPPAPPNNTTNQFREYTINESNIPNEPSFDDAMIAFLLDMQNRDLSPEDYEMLLRLDDRVQRKTLDTNILNTLPTVNVTEIHLHEQCTICMETYTLGQQLKLLPCTHMFHSDCIEKYLKEFSIQCPLDNLPLT